MNGQSGIIGDLNEKWVKGQTRPYGNKELKTKKEKMRNGGRPNMALHLRGILKDQKWSLGAHFFEQTRF